MAIEVYLGIPDARPDYVAACEALGAPMMISASAFSKRWTADMHDKDEPHPGFRPPPQGRLNGRRKALDSMGFTAMMRWGGYPVTPEQYFTQLVMHETWDFWSSQDLCCEPAVAANAEEVMARLMESAWRYEQLRDLADGTVAKGDIVNGFQTYPHPLKILQGWDWWHYLISAEALEVTAEDQLIGIGSVCKRHRSGTSGVLTIIDRLDKELPPGVRFHLFGVTSTVLEELSSHPRCASMDSMSWALALRKSHPTGRTNALAIEYMARFFRAQQAHIAKGGKGPALPETLPIQTPPIWQGRSQEYRNKAYEALLAIRNGDMEAWEYSLKMGMWFPDEAENERGMPADQEQWLADHGHKYSRPGVPAENSREQLDLFAA